MIPNPEYKFGETERNLIRTYVLGSFVVTWLVAYQLGNSMFAAIGIAWVSLAIALFGVGIGFWCTLRATGEI